ncbi:MAG: thiolase family protein [Deltaproteobacteria bacterium]|jgi:acetyl-CoA C-acetyltransferase|nr:thiolase family protein [Deltaproteobacteria bacterium]
MNRVVIVSSLRTPVGRFQGSLGALPAPKLGAIVIKETMKRFSLSAEAIDEVIMGEVLAAGVGQAPARQAAIFGGLSNKTPCLTINKVCGSGLKAVMLGADAITLGHSHVVLAGGQENMTLAPHLLENSRSGFRMGPAMVADSMLKDGLWDPYGNSHMGSFGDLCARENHFTREMQDQFAIESYQFAQNAMTQNYFKNEIVPVIIENKKGNILVDKDEEPFNTQFDKIPTLKPAFEKEGTVTAANASKINDGAAVHLLMSETQAQKSGLKPLARIVAYATNAHDPSYFTTAPVGAIKKVLNLANLKVSDIDRWEINEAFSVVTLFAIKELELTRAKVNSHGGAIAIGHPIGASGARILATLVHGLHTHQQKYGLATLCIGGGEAVAMIIERV